MRMAWWIFMALLAVQIILVQYMVEVYLAEHYHQLPYYAGALGFTFICSYITYKFFQKTNQVREE
ncbi:hypothetical protein [Ectobacillus ponti]|uniref:Uncharacterized protein n=1 Tax=Ectobacillus ponti TaxID=2961894 RepID=A0AA41X9Y3_9BACI|nr:hypothetical protein [Ectobacillus ponti]MCP8969424.1 hypothetical protein [Ectobacillus ponti]